MRHSNIPLQSLSQPQNTRNASRLVLKEEAAGSVCVCVYVRECVCIWLGWMCDLRALEDLGPALKLQHVFHELRELTELLDCTQI